MNPAARALGRTIVATVALALIITGLITANGTIPPAILTALGIALITRLAWVAITEDARHHDQQWAAAQDARIRALTTTHGDDR